MSERRNAFKYGRAMHIVSDYARGLSRKEIAAKHGVSYQRVGNFVSNSDYWTKGSDRRARTARYAQKRREQFLLLQNYQELFEEIMNMELLR